MKGCESLRSLDVQLLDNGFFGSFSTAGDPNIESCKRLIIDAVDRSVLQSVQGCRLFGSKDRELGVTVDSRFPVYVRNRDPFVIAAKADPTVYVAVLGLLLEELAVIVLV